MCGQHNIVRCCFHHLRTGCAILAVYFTFLTTLGVDHLIFWEGEGEENYLARIFLVASSFRIFFIVKAVQQNGQKQAAMLM